MQTSQQISIDLGYLRSVTGGDRNFEKMLLVNALTDIQNNMNILQGACAKKDALSVSSAAHTLKSVVAIAGISPLSSLCKNVNLMFKDGVFRSEGERIISEVIAGWNEARPKLEEVITLY